MEDCYSMLDVVIVFIFSGAIGGCGGLNFFEWFPGFPEIA